MAYTMGIDLSHWSSDYAIENNRSAKFAIMKATEGKSMVDKKRIYFAEKAISTGMAIGFYHYAHPELNSAEEEANNFIDKVKDYPGAVLALDWEGKALECKASWALQWLIAVEKAIGVKPLLYIQNSAAIAMSAISRNDNGLWVARWGSVKPNKSKWPFWAMWQYKGGEVDYNYFNGTIEQFKKYGERK